MALAVKAVVFEKIKKDLIPLLSFISEAMKQDYCGSVSQVMTAVARKTTFKT